MKYNTSMNVIISSAEAIKTQNMKQSEIAGKNKREKKSFKQEK